MAFDSLFKVFVMAKKPEDFEKVYEERFHSESAIHFPFSIGGHPSFFFYHADVLALLNRVKQLEKKATEIYESLPKAAREQYIKKCLIDEIQFTNEIEGVVSTRRDINDILADLASSKKKDSRLFGIVNEYHALLEEGPGFEIQSPLDIRKLYDETLSLEISLNDPKDLPDGELFRKGPVALTRNEKTIHNGLFPEEKIIEALEAALQVLNDPGLDLYLRTGIFHYLFGYIHPFYDGNGRMDRLLTSLTLQRSGLALLPYRLSAGIKERLSDYLEAFKQTNDPRNRGDITTFVFAYLSIILEAYEKTVVYASERKQNLDSYQKRIDEMKEPKETRLVLSALMQSALFSEFGLSRNQLCEQAKMSWNTILKYLAPLFEKGLVGKATFGRNQVYFCKLDSLG